MQIRTFVQLENFSRRLVLTGQEFDTVEHLALKLAALTLFLKWNPQVEIGAKILADLNQEFKPDLAAFNEGGEIALWVECGNVSTNKIEKLARRLAAKIVVLKESVREAENLRRILEKNEVRHRDRIQILAFPDDQFKIWLGSISETVEIFGELSEDSFNLVCNNIPFSFKFETR